jgi:hypothetical protein
MANTCSDIEGVELAVSLLVFQRRYVSLRQIAHMDVIAKA